MSTRTVTTQAELDAAIAAQRDDETLLIDIRSERGVWLDVIGSASVRAFGSASVRAFDSASVRAFDSASVSAFDSASVSAFGSASVRAFGSASVSAFGSASVRAFGSASVRAFGSASVRAFDSASVRASDSASVRASTRVAVHLHSGQAQVEGGVLIDHTDVNELDAAAWADYHGAKAENGLVTLYKAVRADLRSAHDFAYPIGETVTCDDWADNNECGAGLHFSPHPHQASTYDDYATRWLECTVALDDLRPLPGHGGPAKCKAPRATVIREVDEHARPITTTPAETAGTPS